MQRKYHNLIGKIEAGWEERFGKPSVRELRDSLDALFEPHRDGRPVISEGLVSPEGTVRAGDQAPALGRREPGPAAQQRMRDLIAQTEEFIRDPAGTLPHYPLSDMNRGFGF